MTNHQSFDKENPYSFGLDVGNTHTKIGILQKGRVHKLYRIRTEKNRAVDEYYFYLTNICRDLDLKRSNRIIFSSVVPEVSIAFEQLEKNTDFTLTNVEKLPHFSFERQKNPSVKVGADILCMCHAASQIYGPNGIIVSAGTATTFFPLQNNTLKGGVISPGIKGSVEALIEKASLLGPINIEIPPQVVSHTTESAMQSGILFGFADLIDGMVKRIKEEMELGEKSYVVATGGMINKIKKITTSITHVHPELGLAGLALLDQDLINTP